MRVYIFGEDKESCIDLANMLNERGGKAIIGNTIEFEELARRIGKEFDCAIFVSNNPDEDVIEANRERKIRAVVCYNQRGMRDGMKAKANLFILDGREDTLPNPAALLIKAAGAAESVERKVGNRASDRAKETPSEGETTEDDDTADKVRSGFLGRKKAVKQKRGGRRERAGSRGRG